MSSVVVDIMSLEGVEGPQGPEGRQGVPGLNGTGADTGDGATATWVGQAGTVSQTRKALQRNGLTGWYHVEGNGVVIDGGLTDSTAKMQEIFDSVPFGGTVYIPECGYDKWISTSATINVNMQSTRILSVPRDAYATSIRSTVPGLTYFKVFAPSVTFENVGIYGDAIDDYGSGGTQTGIEFFGDHDANVDTKVFGCTLSRLLVGTITRGRNSLIENNLFSGTTWPTRYTGIEPAWHTGPNVLDNRGHIIRLNRFHGCGFDSTGALVYVDPSTRLTSLEISSNHFDQGRNRGFVVTGTAGARHTKVNIFANWGTHLAGNMYELTHVDQFSIRNESFYGGAVASQPTLGANGIVLNNCLIGEIDDVIGFQLGKGGVYARNCTRISFPNVRFRQLGNVTTAVAHGFDIDSTNSQMDFGQISAEEYTGWGFIGSPTENKQGRYTFTPSAGALGRISSTTFLPDTLFVSAIDMIASAGTPAISGTAGGVQSIGWLMDAAVAESVSFQIPRVPSDWGSFSVSALWAPTTALGGAVVHQSFSTPLVAGGTAGGSQTAYGNVTATAPAALNQIVTTVLAAEIMSPLTPVQYRLVRLGADAADTYAADTALLGVLLTRLR